MTLIGHLKPFSRDKSGRSADMKLRRSYFGYRSRLRAITQSGPVRPNDKPMTGGSWQGISSGQGLDRLILRQAECFLFSSPLLLFSIPIPLLSQRVVRFITEEILIAEKICCHFPRANCWFLFKAFIDFTIEIRANRFIKKLSLFKPIGPDQLELY